MPTSMPALVNFAAASGSVALREVPVPTIGSEDVLLKVESVGVCGSDLHQWHGTHSWPVNYPCVLGHEFGGVILQAGADVKRFKEGDRVVSETAAVIDLFSPLTRAGQYNLDPSRKGFGYGVDGAMASYVRVPERCLHAVPDTLPFDKAALTEPCCVAFNAMCMNTRIRPGDFVLVIGPGPIGLLCAAMAKLNGAIVILTGLPADSHRLNVGQQLGVDIVLTERVVEQVRELTGGLGVEVVVDAAGVSDTLKLAIDAVRPAGQITKVGWGPKPLNFSIDPLVQKNVTLQGSFSHNWPVWERVIRLLDSGLINLDPVISKVAPLADWHDCFSHMLDGSYVKAVLKP
ncbi:MAG: zinc-binding dehydrogenase [Rhodothermales bacterium]|nr:zinc-binding dehydrogenase [Rhodothermales bacterium]